VLIVGVVGLAQSQQQKQSLLGQRVSSIDLSTANVDETLISLAGKYNVPVGNEVSSRRSSGSVDAGFQLELKNATVEEILSLLLKNHPDYHWQLADGVINISSDSAPEPLLDTVIGQFEVKQQTIAEIKKDLAERPEVESVLSETNTEFQELTILPGGNAEALGKYTFTLQNASVRQILNRLVLQTEGHYWTLVRLGNNKQLWIIVR
jgi:hypothetical protein